MAKDGQHGGELQSLQEKLRQQTAEIELLKEKVIKQKAKIQRIRKLNYGLQETIIALNAEAGYSSSTKNINSQRSSQAESRLSSADPGPSPAQPHPSPAQPHLSPAEPDLSQPTIQLEPDLLQGSVCATEGPLPDHLIDIGKGLKISRPAWERISGLTKDSMFVKELLVMVWSRRELRERSLLGKHCLRFPGRQPKIPLTPWKVAVLRGNCKGLHIS
ncbi:uncharacterized protein LOC144133927 [Amblyomma americanum]